MNDQQRRRLGRIDILVTEVWPFISCFQDDLPCGSKQAVMTMNNKNHFITLLLLAAKLISFRKAVISRSASGCPLLDQALMTQL
jgi:hypothetical protein